MILKLDRIGDFVLALGAIRLIAARVGEERCALLVAPAVEALAAREFPRMPRIVLPAFVRHKHARPQWAEARRILSEIGGDELWCLRHQRWDYDELILTWVRANQRRVIEDPQAWRWVIGRRSVRWEGAAVVDPPAESGELCRELRLHQALFRQAWGSLPSEDDIRPRLAASIAGAVPTGQGVIAPFSSSVLKDVPERTLADLAAAAGPMLTRGVRLMGAPDQRGRLEAFQRALASVGCHGLEVVTPANLPALVDALSGAAWVLTADSAAAHIATALDRPAVVLLGGGVPHQFGPWRRSDRQVWLQHRLECFGCGWRCTQAEAYCVTRISSREIATALRSVTAAARES